MHKPHAVFQTEQGQPQLVKGIGEIAAHYDAFILDIWGVLHNGVRPYEGVLDCLLQMKAEGKRIVLLTNSPNRAKSVSEHVLIPMGIHEGVHYDALVSSGEAAWMALAARAGQTGYVFWDKEHPTAFEGHNIRPSNDIEKSDFMLASLLPAGAKEDDYKAILQKALEKGLPLYCANPDKYVNIGDDLHLCAGALGDMYEEMGGKVLWYGKPHAPIYDQALSLLQAFDKARIIAVGDSLRTDVRGANDAGIDVLWNLVGIHWEELRHVNEQGEKVAHPERLSASLSEYKARPSALLRGLKW